MEPGRPLAGASSGAVPPKCVFGDFLRIQKVTPRRVGRPHGVVRVPPLLMPSKETGSGKHVPKGEAFG